eukprot:SM000200S05823  [mRNA]  locus=s200:106788:110308:+ [translate_table: standard]
MDILAGRPPPPPPADDRAFRAWFAFADSDGDGRVSGGDAVRFFSRSGLPREQLKQVWALADSGRHGFLGPAEFSAAMRIIALAQAGHPISPSMLADADAATVGLPLLAGLDADLAAAASPEGRGVAVGSGGGPEGERAGPGPGSTAAGLAASGYNRQSHKSRKVGNMPEPISAFKLPDLLNCTSSEHSACILALTRTGRGPIGLGLQPIPQAAVSSVIDGLKRLYFEKLQPLEQAYRFHDFASPLLTEADFDARPLVMLLGQYSTGKTTFIKHLLKREYPGANIGPEPTTDRFVVIMEGADERSVPGNTAFLSKFECSQLPHPLLEHVMFVDTPGVLSGEKQRTQRSYDFTGVTSWFASKADLILLLFDPHKLDISDEFKRVIGSLHGHDDKIRVVLNKADQVDTQQGVLHSNAEQLLMNGLQQLMRVYGALMWSLGKVLNTPEVMRVYIGSFNDKPIQTTQGPLSQELFEKEQGDLLADVKDIPRKSCDRKINEFVKRARAAKIHAFIIGHLRAQMPMMMGKTKTQQRLCEELDLEFRKVQRAHHLPLGDFPDVDEFREILQGFNIDTFDKLKPKLVQGVDDMLGHDIPDLLQKFRNPYD